MKTKRAIFDSPVPGSRLVRTIRLHIVSAFVVSAISIGALGLFGQVPQTNGDNRVVSGESPPASAPAPTATPTPDPKDADSNTNSAANTNAKQKKEKRGTLIPVPIPIISPALGNGMVLGVGYIFQLKRSDKVSPPSVIGLVTAFTSGGTRAGAIGGRLYWGENKYQATFAVGKGRAIYDFYGVGSRPGQPQVSVTLNQSGTVFFTVFMRNFWKNIFIGPRFQYRKISGRIDGAQTPGGFEIPFTDRETTTASLGFHIQRDLRDNSFYPTKGSVWNVSADFFAKALGSVRDYQVYKASYNGYRSMGTKQVIAYRGSVCSVSDTTPFFDLCYYGMSSDLRGYTTGQFQDYRMFAAQVEYRRDLIWRIGGVAFAGFGGVARHWNEFQFDELLPAAGVGFRFRLDKKNHINYRIDWGYGRAGSTLTMSVTEAF